VANAIPFFSDFQSLLGALTGAPIVFGWPALFYLRGCHLNGKRVSLLDRLCCGVFLCVFLPMFTSLGTINAIHSIVTDWSNLGLPFACNLTRV
jgi:vesicular inhibitory amino acid transporter